MSVPRRTPGRLTGRPRGSELLATGRAPLHAGRVLTLNHAGMLSRPAPAVNPGSRAGGLQSDAGLAELPVPHEHLGEGVLVLDPRPQVELQGDGATEPVP